MAQEPGSGAEESGHEPADDGQRAQYAEGHFDSRRLLFHDE